MAATMQNYARSTFLSDIITVPAFTQYVKEAIFERSLFVQSGAVVRNSALDARSGGVKVEVPTWKPLNPTETVIKSDATWGGDGTNTGLHPPHYPHYRPLLPGPRKRLHQRIGIGRGKRS